MRILPESMPANRPALNALRRAGAFLLLAAAAASVAAPPTKLCNTGYSSEIFIWGMSEAVQSRIVAAVADPAADPALYAALWDPLAARPTTTALGNRFVVLSMHPLQDLPEMIAAMRSDPLVASLSIGAIEDNGGVCFAVSPPIDYARVTEYYNTNLGHYFLSSTEAENAIIDAGGAGPGWTRTGESFLTAPPSHCHDSDRVFRFYAPGPSSHYYTASPAECGWLRFFDSGWIAEGVAFGAKLPIGGSCPSSLSVQYTPVFLLYNDRWMFNDSNHRFTIHPALYQQMMSQGWVGYGVGLCVRNGQ